MDMDTPGDEEPEELVSQRMAAHFSAVLSFQVSVLDTTDPRATGYQGYRVKTLNRRHVDVISVPAGWRLTIVPEGAYEPVLSHMRYWYFAGHGMLSLALAIGQAATYDGTDDWRPIHYTKAGDE